MLYFFHGREVVVLAHALTKEDEIPKDDIECAIQRMKLFKTDPKAHTYESEN
jgi:phage-related protein